MHTLLSGLTWLALWGFMLAGWLAVIKPQPRLYFSDRKHGLLVGLAGLALLVGYGVLSESRHHPDAVNTLVVMLALFAALYGVWWCTKLGGPFRQQSSGDQWLIAGGGFFLAIMVMTMVGSVMQVREHKAYLADLPAYQAKVTQEQAAQRYAILKQQQQAKFAAEHEQTRFMDEVEDSMVAVKTALTAKGCAEGPEMCLLLINGSSALLEKAKQSNLSEARKKRVKEFRDALVAAQVRSFPSIRKGYGKVFAEKLWENDLTARTFGEGYRTVEFTGAVLAANRNIKTAMATVYPILRALRMKQARFKWMKAADEYTYYTVEPTYSDKAILVWDGMLVREVPLN